MSLPFLSFITVVPKQLVKISKSSTYSSAKTKVSKHVFYKRDKMHMMPPRQEQSARLAWLNRKLQMEASAVRLSVRSWHKRLATIQMTEILILVLILQHSNAV